MSKQDKPRIVGGIDPRQNGGLAGGPVDRVAVGNDGRPAGQRHLAHLRQVGAWLVAVAAHGMEGGDGFEFVDHVLAADIARVKYPLNILE